MTIQPLTSLAARDTRVTAAAAAASPSRDFDRLNLCLAQQARIFLPVAELIAREIAYETGSLHEPWTLDAPQYREEDLANWTTMFGAEERPVAKWRVGTRAYKTVGSWFSSPPPAPAPRADAVVQVEYLSESACQKPWRSALSIPEGAAAAASSSGPADDSFRMIWGRVEQQAGLHPGADEETAVFIGFRGTANNDGWAADFANPGPHGLHPGEQRFHKLANERDLFWPALNYALERARDTGKKARILITGHSLGGSDCERYAALFTWMLAHAVERNPTIQDHIAGVTVVPFNSPGTSRSYGEVFAAAAEALEHHGIDAVCIDMKQDGDTVQKAAQSRISLGAPRHSTIIKMKIAGLLDAHTAFMTIEASKDSSGQTPHHFSVLKYQLQAELSPVERAVGSQISGETGRLRQRALNLFTGVLPTVTRKVFARPEQLTEARTVTDDEISDELVETMNRLGIQTDSEMEQMKARDLTQGLNTPISNLIAELVKQHCAAKLQQSAYQDQRYLSDADEVVFEFTIDPAKVARDLQIIFGGERLPLSIQLIIDREGAADPQRILELGELDHCGGLESTAAAAASSSDVD
jgi:hypothetical protein